MDRDQFWSIIDKVKATPEPEAAVAEELKALPPEEIASYQEHFDTLFEAAYKWDLWGAAYLIEGGCSDDGFIDFRYGLISKGRQVYEQALATPDSLASIQADEISNELFGYAAMEVYEEKTGGEPIPRREPTGPSDPEGEQWDFDDDTEAARRLPNLFAKYGYAGDEEEGSEEPEEGGGRRKPWWRFW